VISDPTTIYKVTAAELVFTPFVIGGSIASASTLHTHREALASDLLMLGDKARWVHPGVHLHMLINPTENLYF